MTDHSVAADVLRLVSGGGDRHLELGAFRDARILVNGACGGIGKALVDALSLARCAALGALDMDDHALVEMRGEARTVVDHIANVRDRRRMDAVMAAFRPDLVLHAVALRNVALAERHPGECVLTNLVGARNAVRAAEAAGARAFLAISSDKAASPTNMVGATLRLAELYVADRNGAAQRAGAARRFLSVRLGNVFGTKGSVGARFARQIAAGGPVTLTHPDMRRYFMTLPEATGLVLKAAAGAGATRSGGQFVLDVGRPMRIRDLAERMIAAASSPARIEITGVRPGEKLDEDLYDDHERVAHAGIEGMVRVASPSARAPTDPELDALETLARAGRDEALKGAVTDLLAACLSSAAPTAPAPALSRRSRARDASAPDPSGDAIS
jgi:O-antigen biosynthesis protein WbqV